jgi:hypothetical protein
MLSCSYLFPLSHRYRVYPEPWQVILQAPYNKSGRVVVEDIIAMTSDSRPTYQQCVQALIKEAQTQKA